MPCIEPNGPWRRPAAAASEEVASADGELEGRRRADREEIENTFPLELVLGLVVVVAVAVVIVAAVVALLLLSVAALTRRFC